MRHLSSQCTLSHKQATKTEQSQKRRNFNPIGGGPPWRPHPRVYTRGYPKLNQDFCSDRDTTLTSGQEQAALIRTKFKTHTKSCRPAQPTNYSDTDCFWCGAGDMGCHRHKSGGWTLYLNCSLVWHLFWAIKMVTAATVTLGPSCCRLWLSKKRTKLRHGLIPLGCLSVADDRLLVRASCSR